MTNLQDRLAFCAKCLANARQYPKIYLHDGDGCDVLYLLETVEMLSQELLRAETRADMYKECWDRMVDEDD